MISELENLVVRLTAEGSQYTRMMGSIEAATVATVGRLQALGAKASVAITAPLVAAATFGVQKYGAFNDSMTKSTAIMVGLTGELRREMESTAKAISGDSITVPAKVAEAYYFLASAGLDAKASIAALATVEQFAVAGAFDMATATSLLADSQSALGMRSADATENMRQMKRVADVLSQANIAANASSQQFAIALTTKSAAALRSLNKDVEEGVAVLAAFADQGIKAENAGEKLSIVLRDLQTASITQREEWQRYGLTVFDSAGKMRPVVDIIQDLEGSLGKMSDRQKKKSILDLGFSDMSVSALLSLLGTSSKIREYEKALRSAGGATEKIAKEQMKSFPAQLAIVGNRATLLAMDVGEVLAPHLLKIGDAISKVVDWLRRLTPDMRTLVVLSGIAAAAMGPLLIVVSRLGMVGLVAARSLLGFSGGALRASVAPLGLLARVMASAATAGGMFGAQMLAGARRAAVAVASASASILSSATMVARRWGPSLVSAVGNSLAQLPGIARNAFATAQGALQAFVRGWTGNLALLTSQTNLVFNRIGAGARYALARPADYVEALFPGAIDRGMEKASKFFTMQLLRMRVAGLAFYSGITGADLPYRSRVGQTAQWVGQQFHQAWSFISQKVGAAYQVTSNRVGVVTAQLTSRAVALYELMRSRVSRIWTSIAGAGSGRMAAVGSSISQALRGAWNMVPAQARNAFARLVPLVRADGSRIGAALVAGVRFAVPVASSAIVSGMQGAFALVRSGASMTGRFVTRLGGGFFSLLGQVSSLVGMLGSSGGAVASWAASLSTFALVLPAVGSITAILVSFPGIVMAGVAAWAALSESGQAFTTWLVGTFGPSFKEASSTISGIASALKSGDFSLAGRVAMAGLKSVFYTGLRDLSVQWDGFAQGLVEVFLGSAQLVGEIWIKTVGGIAQGMIKAAQQEGLVGDIMAQVLGTDVRNNSAEMQARWISQNADAARIARKDMEAYQKQVESLRASGGSAEAIAEAQAMVEKMDALRRKYLEKSKNPNQAFLGSLDTDLASGLPKTEKVLEEFRDRMGKRMGAAGKFLDGLEGHAADASRELEDLLKTVDAQAAPQALEDAANELAGVDAAATQATGAVDALQDAVSKPVILKFSAEGIQAVETHTAEAMARLEAYRSTAAKRIPIMPDAVGKNVLDVKGFFGNKSDYAELLPTIPDLLPQMSPVSHVPDLGPSLPLDAASATDPGFTADPNADEIRILLQELVSNTAPRRETANTVLIPIGSLRENA